jgi:glycosyltransferase involved in cell wall biosynthesis/putative flippase GtrA
LNIIEQHKVRFGIFGLIGGTVFLLGMAGMYLLVSVLGLNAQIAFFITGVFSIELSFFLNWLITWRDSQAPFWPSFWRFNITRFATVPLSQGFYALLLWGGVQYLWAVVINVAVFTLVNYVLGFWAYRKRQGESPQMIPHEGQLPARLAAASVVIPVKNSQQTIRKVVESLLVQDYPGKFEIILVGDVNDRTWPAVMDYINSGQVKVIEIEVNSPGRDTSSKRNAGFIAATGEILCSTDSDTVLPENWISTGGRFIADGWDCVSGPLQSVDDTFWGFYIDRNEFASKTPRIKVQYTVTQGNFGLRRKPPVTGNTIFTKRAFKLAGLFDESFVHHYDDYEFFYRMAKAGCAITCVPELLAGISHRSSFRGLLSEYVLSGRGCAHFIRKHPESHFAHARLVQLGIVCLAPALLYWPLMALGAALVGTIFLSAASVKTTGKLKAAVFPLITLACGLLFTWGMLRGLIIDPFTHKKVSVVQSPRILRRANES